MKYTAKGHRNQYFELYNDFNEPLGTLNYPEWFSSKGTINTPGGNTYELGPSNFWMTSIDMKKDGEVLASAKRNWGMNVVVTLGSIEYHFHAQGLLNRSFVLTNEQNQEVAVLKPDFRWKDLSFAYEIETNDDYSELSDPAIILFLIYSCNYIMRSQYAGMA